eukprot:333398-Rhodomonas_salina.3
MPVMWQMCPGQPGRTGTRNAIAMILFEFAAGCAHGVGVSLSRARNHWQTCQCAYDLRVWPHWQSRYPGVWSSTRTRTLREVSEDFQVVCGFCCCQLTDSADQSTWTQN